MNPNTYYVPEGEERHLEIVGVRIGNEEAEPLCFLDGTALYLLCRVREAETDQPLMLKQFGASQLLLSGLSPDALDPGMIVRVKRWEDGGYEVENEPDSVDGVEDAM